MPAPADFKSPWTLIDSDSFHVVEIEHNLGYAPQTASLIFSPTDPAETGGSPPSVYYMEYRWFDSWAQNPISFRTDATKFYLSITQRRPIFSAFGLEGQVGEWSQWNRGWIQLMAFKVIDWPTP